MYYIGQQFKTGEKAPVSGIYIYVRHTSSTFCVPTQNERSIPLAKGDPFPPHKSCQQGVIWQLSQTT